MAELLVYDEAAPAVSGETGADRGHPDSAGRSAGSPHRVQETVDLDLSKFVVEDGSELSYEIRVREDRGGADAEWSAGREPAGGRPQANQVGRKRKRRTGRASRSNVATAGQASRDRHRRQSIGQSSATTLPPAHHSPLPAEHKLPTDSAKPSTGASTSGNRQSTKAEQAADSHRTAAKKAQQARPRASKTRRRQARGNPHRRATINRSHATASQRRQTAASSQRRNSRRREASGSARKRPPADTASASPEADKMASNPPNASATASEKKPAEPEQMPRTASSGRQSLSGDRAATRCRRSAEETEPTSQNSARPEFANLPTTANASAVSPQSATPASESSSQSPPNKQQQQASHPRPAIRRRATR